MNLNSIDQTNNPTLVKKTSEPISQEALREVAQQFEAVLLMQLTSTLNGSEDDSEDSLFGSDGGSGLAKKMFSEQMATAMANAGGIGLKELIMQKFQGDQPKPTDNKLNPLQKTISTVKDIRNLSSQQVSQNNFTPVENVSTQIDSGSEFTGPMTPSQNFVSKRERIVADKLINYSEDISSPSEVYSPNLVADSSPNFSRAVSFQMPANGRISSTFGSRFHPIDKKVKFHGGLDIAVPLRTRVNSAADGVVAYAGKKGGYGNVVIVQHPDGRETRYGHLEKILVSVGDSVSAGQEVAKSGSTGKSTGPHLHFEVRENGQVVNPLKILSNVLPKRTDR